MPTHRPTHRALGAGLLAVPLLLTLAGAPAQGAARPDSGQQVHQVHRLPGTGKFVVQGHGYGHGHGMSQYGAEGAARKGLTTRQILRFYYPHTSLERSRARIAVLITADTSRDLQVRAQQGLTAKDRGTGKVHRLPARLGGATVTRWRFTVRDRQTIVQYRTGRWHDYRPGGHRHFRGDGEFASPNHRLALITPSGARTYRGVLRSARPTPTSKDRDTVNVIGVDDYVRGVVPAEMPASWHQAAVRAQAVAARTYALRERADNLHRYYQICDTTACQVYGGVAAEHPLGDKAVRASAGQYLSYQGKPAFTQFSASDGGWTADGDQPYLPARQDPYDGWSGNHVHSWSVKLDESVLEKHYPQIGDLKSVTFTSRDGHGQWGGRVLELRLTGSKDSVTISGDDFRYLYGLRSTWFTIK